MILKKKIPLASVVMIIFTPENTRRGTTGIVRGEKRLR